MPSHPACWRSAAEVAEERRAASHLEAADHRALGGGFETRLRRSSTT
jgi:hypothetical protein